MRKIIIYTLIAIMLSPAFGLYAEQESVMGNVFEDIPYQDKGMGKRKLVDEKHLLMMQAALRPGQSVPQHNANANVNLIVLEGEIVVNLDGEDIVTPEGALLPVAYNTPMNINNKSQENATFLIIKTPNPSEM